MAKAPHHSGTYLRTAMKLRAAAYANPDTRCWRCGKTLMPGVKGYDKWTAGHTRDSDPTAPLAPEHARCNYSAGALLGIRLRDAKPSRRWL